MLIKPGARIRLEVALREPPVVLLSSVRKCTEAEIEILAPSINGKKLAVPSGTKLTLVEMSPDGILRVETEVKDCHPKPVPIWELPIPGLSGIQSIQRRRQPRYEIDLHLRWRMRGDEGHFEEHPLHVININTLGALISVDRDLELGDEVYIDLTPVYHVGGHLSYQAVVPRCKVVRALGETHNLYGVIFENLSRMERIDLEDPIRRLKCRIV